MVIFYSYVSLPEGNFHICFQGSSAVAELAKRAAALLDLPVAKTKIACGGEVCREETYRGHIWYILYRYTYIVGCPLSLCIPSYIYIYIYTHRHMYIYIYICRVCICMLVARYLKKAEQNKYILCIYNVYTYLYGV